MRNLGLGNRPQAGRGGTDSVLPNLCLAISIQSTQTGTDSVGREERELRWI